MRWTFSIIAAFATVLIVQSANAFCGFYVAKADTKLFNKASQVVIVRDEDRTVLTMANDYQGAAKDFAVVIPVPTFIERGQINVGDRAVIEHLDAYTSPRLVEYHDADPCRIHIMREKSMMSGPMAAAGEAARADALKKGVTIEAQYTVGEYDILILSAKESSGLIGWLKNNGYKIPNGAGPVVRSYMKQGMRFFVAKVNIAEQQKLGFSYLRPLQVAYESPRFMLPIRLGTVNANGQQELYVYALTRSGRIETTNYRTVKIPTGVELPEHVDKDFGDFYRAMFKRQTERENNRAVFLEYAWDMNWCDPCAADPLSRDELKSLGVFWLDQQRPFDPRGSRKIAPPQPAQNVFVTRLHVRYDAKHFPEDLMFQETGDRQNYQGRYVIRRPWTGTANCAAAENYREQLVKRQNKEAEQLANLTGWDINDIRAKIGLNENPDQPGKETKWWQRLWSRN